MRHFQALSSPKTFNPFVIHSPSFRSKQSRNSKITVSSDLRRQRAANKTGRVRGAEGSREEQLAKNMEQIAEKAEQAGKEFDSKNEEAEEATNPVCRNRSPPCDTRRSLALRLDQVVAGDGVFGSEVELSVGDGGGGGGQEGQVGFG